MPARIILLVSNREDLTKTFRDILGVKGYETIVATHGNDALQILTMRKADALICDASIPEMDAYHLCYKIRESEKLKHLAVIIYSDAGSADETKMAEDMGADVFISSPGSPQLVLGYVDDIFMHPEKYSIKRLPNTMATASLLKYNERLIARLEQQNKDLLIARDELGRTVELLKEAQKIGHIGSWEINMETRECQWSDEVFRIFGTDRENTKASVESFMAFVHSEDITVAQETLSGFLSNEIENPSLTFRIIQKNGAIRHIFGRSGYTRKYTGEAAKSFGILSDVTERVEYENRILELNANLEEKVKQRTAELLDANQQLESFTYSVSHDLRSPIRSIHAFAQLIQRKYARRMGADCTELLNFISESAMNMDTLVEDLLAFSRLGRRDIDKSVIDMHAVAHKVWMNMITGSERIPQLKMERLPAVLADKTMITQVWVNFLSNAIKYSGKKEQALIEISSFEQGKETVFMVRDNGIGFDMRFYDKLFGVFQRLHGTGDFEGTGVGLALVKRIIDKHHGRVWAESTPGNGATFYFTLPLE